MVELLRREGFDVILVTPAALVSIFTRASLEQAAIQSRLIELGVRIEANMAVAAINHGSVTLACVFSGREREMETASCILVTARDVIDGLFRELMERKLPVSRAGDCYGPGTIAAAVHSGRKFAEDFGGSERDFLDLPFRREVTGLKNSDVAQTTSSGSLVDLTGASIAFTQGGSTAGCVVLNASFEILSTNAGSVRAEAFLDGTTSSVAGLVVLTEGPMSIGTSSDFNFLFPNVLPGAHTVKLQVLSGSLQSITFRKWAMVLTVK